MVHRCSLLLLLVPGLGRCRGLACALIFFLGTCAGSCLGAVRAARRPRTIFGQILPVLVNHPGVNMGAFSTSQKSTPLKSAPQSGALSGYEAHASSLRNDPSRCLSKNLRPHLSKNFQSYCWNPSSKIIYGFPLKIFHLKTCRKH